MGKSGIHPHLVSWHPTEPNQELPTYESVTSRDALIKLMLVIRPCNCPMKKESTVGLNLVDKGPSVREEEAVTDNMLAAGPCSQILPEAGSLSRSQAGLEI